MNTPVISLPERLSPLVPILVAHQKHQQAKAFLEMVIDMLPGLMAVTRCSIFILDPVNNRVLLQFGTNLLEKELNFPVDGSLAGEVIQKAVPRVVEDLTPFDQLQKEIHEMTGFQAQAMLCLPIFHPNGKGRCIGALELLHIDRHRPFTANDIEDLTLLCRHLQDPLEELVCQHVKFLEDLEKKKKKGRKGLVESFLSKWMPVKLGK